MVDRYITNLETEKNITSKPLIHRKTTLWNNIIENTFVRWNKIVLEETIRNGIKTTQFKARKHHMLVIYAKGTKHPKNWRRIFC